MSMKRSKKASSSSSKGSQGEGSLGFNPPPSALPRWDEIVASQPDESFSPYSVGASFERNALVNHVKFGKGVVLGVDGKKIEVLFSDGVKKLAHGGG